MEKHLEAVDKAGEDFLERATLIRQEVKGCARCGEDHQTTFRKFTNPQDDFKWWGICVILGEPVLMKTVGDVVKGSV